MSRSGSYFRAFGDAEEVEFRLTWAMLEKLQEKLDVGPLVLNDRLMNRAWTTNDVKEVIRFGLIGGGMSVNDAAKMINLYVVDVPPLMGGETSNVALAAAIMAASLVGAPDEILEIDDPGKAEAPNESTAFQTESFVSVPSMPPLS